MALAVAGLAACGGDSASAPLDQPPPPEATVFTATGNIVPKVDEFREVLGPSNGGAAGEQEAGRREVNWDGAAANPFDNRDDFPGDFFNTTVTAGTVYTTPGTGMRNDSTLFIDVNPSYPAEFNVLTPKKIFSPVGSNVLDQEFLVAGEATPAVVRGFAAVFSDVDLLNRTTIRLYARDGSVLGTFAVPPRSDATGLSFLGITYDEPVIARVRMTLGTAALGADVEDITAGGDGDLVVVDNVIYGEPTAAP